MTPPAAHYLTLLRCLSDDEVSEWRHEHDWTERMKPSDLVTVRAMWALRVLAKRTPTYKLKRAATIEAG